MLGSEAFVDIDIVRDAVESVRPRIQSILVNKRRHDWPRNPAPRTATESVAAAGDAHRWID